MGPYCYNHWLDIDLPIKQSKSIDEFKSKYIKLMRPPKPNLFGIQDRHGLRLLTRMGVEFSDLREHRFDHNFNCPTPVCKCGTESESTEHFLLRCPLFSLHRLTLFSNIASAVNNTKFNLPDEHLSSILLFGSPTYNSITNKSILTTTIHVIKFSGRFNKIEAYTQHNNIISSQNRP